MSRLLPLIVLSAVAIHGSIAAATSPASEPIALELHLERAQGGPLTAESIASAIMEEIANRTASLEPSTQEILENPSTAALLEGSAWAVSEQVVRSYNNAASEDEDDVEEIYDLVIDLVLLALETADPYLQTALGLAVDLLLGNPENQEYIRVAGACQTIGVSDQGGAVPGQLAMCTFDAPQLLDALASQQTGTSVSQVVQRGLLSYAIDVLLDQESHLEPSVVTTTKASYQPGERYLNHSVWCQTYNFEEHKWEDYDDCPIEISWSVQAGSGEHDHGGARPRGQVEVPARSATGDDAGTQATAGEVTPPVNGDALISTTTGEDSNGLTYSYIAPESSGLTNLSVTGFKGTEYSPITLDYATSVFIAGLNGQSSYSGPGGAQWSIKPSSAVPHNNQNYYATDSLLGRLNNMAEFFHSLSNAFLQTAPPPVITELSLPQGGLFDYMGAAQPYRPPHKTHRRGEAADIRINGYTNLQVTLLDQAIRASGLRTPVPRESYVTCAGWLDPNAPHGCGASHFHAEADPGTIDSDEL